MAKYTLLIADDEEIECKALRLLVQKELPEIEEIGSVIGEEDLRIHIEKKAFRAIGSEEKLDKRIIQFLYIFRACIDVRSDGNSIVAT